MAPKDIPPPPSPEDPAPESGLRRWLIGCGCGCAVLLAVLVAVMFFLVQKLMGTGVQLPSDHLLKDDTVAAIQVDSPTAAADARGFLLDAMRALLAGVVAEVPSEQETQEFQELMVMLEDLEASGGGFGPTSFTLVLAPDGDELAMAFAVNLDKGAPLMRYSLEFLALAGATEHERDGHVAYELDANEAEFTTTTTSSGVTTTETVDFQHSGTGSFFVGFQHDTAIFSDSKELLLDTLAATAFEETPGAPPPSPLRRELTDLRSDWLLAAALVDHPLLDPAELLASDLDTGAMDLSWADAPFGAARLGLGVEGRDLLMRLEVDGLDPADVERVAAGFEELGAARAAQLAEHELDLPYEVIAGETSLLVQAGLPDLRDWLDERARVAQPVESASEDPE